jgi:pyruvate decarboxylase
VGDNGLQWKGNANELIASYAADGYGRINGAAAFVTTFGPGELSAYCGMAGHFCEFVPVVHIVGYPSTGAMNAQTIMHHTLGDGRFDMYEEMSKQVTAGTAVLRDPKTAAAEIDKLLTIMMQQSRPVYLGVPTDLAYETVDDEGLKDPIDISLPKDDPETLKTVVSEIRALFERAAKPTVVVDGSEFYLHRFPSTG